MGTTIKSVNANYAHSIPSTALYTFGYNYNTKILTAEFVSFVDTSSYTIQGLIYYEFIGYM